MKLSNKLLVMADRLEDRLPAIKAREEKAKRNMQLKEIVNRGNSYSAENAYANGDRLSNEFLINLGAGYHQKTGAVSNATFINGGITGDSLESPFQIDYGKSNQYLRPSFGFNPIKKALSLLVTSDRSRTKGRLDEAACLIEFAKYMLDSTSESVGNDLEQREIIFQSRSSQVHSPMYEAIGNRALKVIEAGLKANSEAYLVEDMYCLAKDCHSQSKLPVSDVRVSFGKSNLQVA